MGFLDFGRKMISKATNNKVAKALPGGKSLGKSIRNAPGLAVRKPVQGGLAPSPAIAPQPVAPQQLPAPAPEPMRMSSPEPMRMEPAPAPAPSPTPSIGEPFGAAMGRPAVSPPMMEQEPSGLAPQAGFAALAQRMNSGSRPIRRMR